LKFGDSWLDFLAFNRIQALGFVAFNGIQPHSALRLFLAFSWHSIAFS